LPVSSSLDDPQGPQDNTTGSDEKSHANADSEPTTAVVAKEITTQPPLLNSVGMKLKRIPAGTFMMGDANGPGVTPQHRVTLTDDFYIGIHEVTNSPWKRVMGDLPYGGEDNERPVELLIEKDAIEFCKRLSALPREREAGRVYRLPTEAEWEYACRAGTNTRYCFGDNASPLGEYGWFLGNSQKQRKGTSRQDDVFGNPLARQENNGETRVGGRKKPNPWGLYDMHGNVAEICIAWEPENPKRLINQMTPDAIDAPLLDSESLKSAGGGCHDGANECRSASRETQISGPVGFRVVLHPPN
jgi:formylglycine-generating enzyme required for sulfatase activity